MRIVYRASIRKWLVLDPDGDPTINRWGTPQTYAHRRNAARALARMVGA